jgi:hypothetical protein
MRPSKRSMMSAEAHLAAALDLPALGSGTPPPSARSDATETQPRVWLAAEIEWPLLPPLTFASESMPFALGTAL